MKTDTTRTLLEEKLQSATSPWDRLPLLVKLSDWYFDNDPVRASAPAFEALHIAKSLDDRYWIARSFCAIGQGMMGQDRFSEVLFYLDQASQLFDTLGEPYWKAIADHYRAKIYQEIGDIEQAVKLALENLNFFEENDDQYWLSRTFFLIAGFYELVGEHSEAFHCCRKGLRIAKREGFDKIIGLGFLLFGRIYEKMGDLDRAVKYFHQYLQLSIAIEYKMGVALASGGLASLYVRKHDKDKVKTYADQAQALYHELGFPAREAMELDKLGTIYQWEKNFTQALLYSQKSIDILEKTENKVYLAYAHKNKAIVHGYQDRSDLGIPHLLKALELIKDSGDLFGKYQVYEALAVLYEDVQDPVNALKYHKMYVAAKEDYAGAEKQRKLKEEELSYRIKKMKRELRRRDSEVVSLKEENKRKEAELLALALELAHKNEAFSILQQNKEPQPFHPAYSLTENHESTNWDTFARQFHKVHQSFYFKLLHDYPTLTPTEVKICSLIRIGLSSKEMASILCISKRTVDTHRVKVHKKMSLPSHTSLSTFILEL